MPLNTADLIRRLASEGKPAPPLPSPWARAALWLAVSVPYLLALYALWPHPSAGASADRRFIIEQVAVLATAVTAAGAAFASVVPGAPRKLLLIPLAPLGVWLGSLGQMCARDWAGVASLAPIAMHWGCFTATVIAGLLPTVTIVRMLRRGAPLTPRLTTALAALAVAALANFGIRFVHGDDASIVVLVWHVAAVFALSAALATRGEWFLNWRMVAAGLQARR